MLLRTRGVALLSVTAALAGGSLTTVSAASAASDRPTSDFRLLGLPILGDLLNGILNQLAGATVATIQALIGGLTSTQVGDLIQSATGNDLTKLLQAAQNTGQLTSALDTLAPAETADLLNTATPAQLTTLLNGLTGDQLATALTAGQLGDLLAPLTGGDLTSVLGALSATELQNALATLLPGELASVVDGLTAGQTAGLLTTATPTQLTSLLGALTGGQLTGALGTLTPTQLTSLLGTANALVPGAAGGPAAAPLQGLITQLTALLGGGGGTTPPPAPNPTPPAPKVPGAVTPAPRPAAPQFTGYRASVGTIKLNKKRTSMKFTLTCAANAPKGCLVKVGAKIAGKSAMRSTTVVLLRGKSTPITVTFSKSTTKRLKSKGGSLKITAQTALSSLPAASRTLKVKRLKTVKKTVR